MHGTSPIYGQLASLVHINGYLNKYAPLAVRGSRLGFPVRDRGRQGFPDGRVDGRPFMAPPTGPHPYAVYSPLSSNIRHRRRVGDTEFEKLALFRILGVRGEGRRHRNSPVAVTTVAANSIVLSLSLSQSRLIP